MSEIKSEGHELKPEDYAYLAGIFDGEGSFFFNLHKSDKTHNYKNAYYSWGADIYNSDKTVLDWIKTRFGGNIIQRKPRGNQKVPYRLMFHKEEFLKFVPKILPFLIIKKRRCELLLEFTASRKKNPRNRKNGELIGNPYSLREEEIIKEVYRLNKRGRI